ncbi:MAG: ATP-binding protein [Verrucomicrobiaceae bacterium]|nr:ATP-binding protein [Verrucomicrobiaceae bacterium]
MFQRILSPEHLDQETCFLWGPRQSGKSTLLRELFPEAPYYDLLLAKEYRRLAANPGLLAEECAALGWSRKSQLQPIIIDEVQKLPELLDEVHALISRLGLRFILTGSSPRKLLRGGGNLLGGRAVRHEMFPLVSAEVPDIDLDRALNHGLLPRHYLSAKPAPLLDAYVGDYLREEVLAEALTRSLPAFQRFLEAAAFSNGQIVNFTSISREIGVAANTVRGYFEVLVDTLIATWVPAWTKRAKRRVIESPRFYFFDVGVVNDLSHRGKLHPGSSEYGAAFEHFLFMELRAHTSYRGGLPISYWRTASGLEVDFILGDGQIAIEAKSSDNITSDHLKGLRAWREEHPHSRCLLVSRAPRARITEDKIEILPWQSFVKMLWQGQLVAS